jgi:hypothetical protein
MSPFGGAGYPCALIFFLRKAADLPQELDYAFNMFIILHIFQGYKHLFLLRRKFHNLPSITVDFPEKEKYNDIVKKSTIVSWHFLFSTF